ncbi:uncharacterized protein LOC141586650 [Silene latifolia]|uniref:uncharacterized protein LOC141586650 n=1 Tax=Silene latifolia TaxID=37657 RepID=UPI003D76BAA9
MVVQKHQNFNFHPLCKRIQLSHLCFADDLIIFCKAERGSVGLMMKAYESFSKATGPVMNKSKSSLYCNGIDDQVLRDLEHITGMKRGTFPFTYLGVTFSPKRLSIMDCNCLVDHLVDRIRGLGSRKLSYAGRIVLIQSVLSTLHSYWARIFILLKAVISNIEGIGRSFLWHGSDPKENPALISWDNVCKPMRQGGLGLKNLHQWNIAVVGKYVWWVAKKADHLWVRWVHAI